MKKRNLILFVLVALTLLSACGKGKKGSETLAETEPTPVVTATPEPLPDPVTVVLDPEKGISATFGVAEGDAEEVEEEEPSATPTAAPSPTASPTPVPVPEDPAQTAYELFYAMSPEQKDEFMHSFESMDAFYEWLVAAQAEFEEKHPEIEIGPNGVIDLSEYAQ